VTVNLEYVKVNNHMIFRFNAITLASLLLILAACSHDRQNDGYWGASKDMLRMHVEVTKQANGKHWVEVEFQNISDKPMQIWESGFWPNTKLQCRDTSGKEASTTPEGEMLLKAFSPGGSRLKNYLRSFAPGQTHYGDSVELERVYELEPNTTYEVSTIYQETWTGGWTGAITSNMVSIRAE